MIILNGSSQILQAVMGAAATTTEPSYSISYVDVIGASLQTGNATVGVLNGTSNVNMLTGSSTDQYSVKSLSIFNQDTVAQTVTVQKSVSSTIYPLYKETLNPGDSLHYDDGAGWYVTPFNGNAAIGVSQLITSGTTFTTPSYINTATNFTFTLVGGGGGGGGINTASAKGSGGGGGGVSILYATGLSPSTAYTVQIGQGGAGGISVTTPASAGTATQITLDSITYSAPGGGAGADTIDTAGGTGGAPSNSTGGFVTTAINIAGGDGEASGAATADNPTGAGGDAVGWGAGGAALGGNTAGATGNPGKLYGGGGSAGNGATSTGGAGANGAILVEW
jgi:hypothetical protein